MACNPIHRPAAPRCPSCQLARINGLLCHEAGCPDAHLFTTFDCQWCGTEFVPETPRGNLFCSDECAADYYG